MLLFTIFLIKLFAHINIFNYINLKHGHIILSIARRFEQAKYKLVRVNKDIEFIKKCKTDDLDPIFAETRVSLKHGNKKLRQKIRTLICNTELNNKHRERRDILREIKTLQDQLSRTLSFFEYNGLIYRLTKQIASKKQKIHEKQQSKLERLNHKKSAEKLKDYKNFVKQSIHNFSSYQLTAEEQVALSFGLDQHIPTSLRRDDVKTEFELFFQNLLRTISPLPDEKKEVLKLSLIHI